MQHPNVTVINISYHTATDVNTTTACERYVFSLPLWQLSNLVDAINETLAERYKYSFLIEIIRDKFSIAECQRRTIICDNLGIDTEDWDGENYDEPVWIICNDTEINFLRELNRYFIENDGSYRINMKLEL